MPKSKRNKQVELSKTKKHGLEGKKHLLGEIRSCVENYAHLFIFSVSDMRNSKMKCVRDQWKQSRFFIGKNKVMARALGRSPEEEYRTNLYKIGQNLKGERGLLFSNKSTEEVLNWFSSYSEGDYARSGNVASENVSLKEGPLLQFPHSLESYLRQLGLPTTLKKGVIHLLQDYDVCKVGDVLTPDVARILKLLGYEMAEFHIKIECVWSQDGTFLDLKSDSKENIVGDGIKSAMKEGFQISEDLSNLNNVEKMEIMECDVEKEEEQKTHASPSIEESTIDNDEDAIEEEENIIENKTEETLGDDSEEEDSGEEEPSQDIIKKKTEETLGEGNEESEEEDSEEEEPSDKVQENKEDIKEEITDSTALLNLTMEKMKEVECTPPKKYSPKMTRSRARASAVKKVLTPEERTARITRSAKKVVKSK